MKKKKINKFFKFFVVVWVCLDIMHFSPFLNFNQAFKKGLTNIITNIHNSAFVNILGTNIVVYQFLFFFSSIITPNTYTNFDEIAEREVISV